MLQVRGELGTEGLTDQGTIIQLIPEIMKKPKSGTLTTYIKQIKITDFDASEMSKKIE